VTVLLALYKNNHYNTTKPPGKAPINKNAWLSKSNGMKGEKPITKNIRVIDAAGNKYEATYPKRAKGLVKNGRARFIDEHTLCLACPPNNNLEDKSMNNEMENRSNGPRPEENRQRQSWAKQIDIAALAEYMESEDIVEMLKTLPKEMLMKVDMAEMVEHMESDDIVEVIKNLPVEALMRVDFAELAEHMESEHIVNLIESLPAEHLQRIDINSIAEHMDSKEIVKLVKKLIR